MYFDFIRSADDAGMPSPIQITVKYSPELQRITKTPGEPAVISQGLPFIQFLFFIFQSYPQIEQLYPPGTVAMSVNGVPPETDYILRDGDKVEFGVGYEGR